MCGIVGFAGIKNDPLLHEMNKALDHRGPDSDGFYSSDRVSLGNRRLAIVDLESGHQPSYNQDKNIVVVFNGEIYNYLELRRELEDLGHHFQSHHSDTELIPHLYERYGEQWTSKVNGMYAVAIYDRRKQHLILTKDRIGKKPLYYYISNGKLYFASEIKSILKVKGKWEIDRSSLINYLQVKNTSSPNTIFKEIKQLDYAQSLTWSLEKHKLVELKRYWDIQYNDKRYHSSDSELQEEFDHLFKDSLSLRTTCDVEYGTFLSGGIDSSLVSRLTRDQVRNQLKTFSLGYEDDFKNKQNDLMTARKYAEELGTDHHELILSKDTVFKQLHKVMEAFDEPFSGTISTYFLSSLISEYVKVALSGDGADELFGSYLAHRIATPIELLNSPGVNSNDPRWGAYHSGEKRQWIHKIASKDILNWRRQLCVFKENELNQLLHETMTESELAYSKYKDELHRESMLNQSLELDQKELLHNHIFPFVDRLSMAHSLEVRVPFMDYRVIDFSTSIHPDQKIFGEQNKVFLKNYTRKYLPNYIIDRPKEGFVLPVYQWIETELFSSVEDRILNSSMIDKLNLSKTYLESILNDFRTTKKNHAQIWNLYSLAVWFEAYQDIIY